MHRPRVAALVLLLATLIYMISARSQWAQVKRLGPSGHNLTVPTKITRGVPFEVTYRYVRNPKETIYLYAMYGLDKDHSARYPPLGFPAFIHPDGSPDEGVAVPLLDSDARKVAKYTWTLLLPESDTDSLGKYLDGEAILGVALYGIRGIKMGPVLASANATTFVS